MSYVSIGGGSIYIGIDDTDSLEGMCTTYLLTELIRELPELDVIGYPRLVRLNPMIPWKTRGNGALCIRLGNGGGKKHIIGRIGEKECWGFDAEKRAAFFHQDIGWIRERLEGLFDKYAMFDAADTNPAFVISRGKLPAALYRDAVRGIVRLQDAVSCLKKSGAVFRGYKNRRGIIGASAAVSWEPGDRTYEVIAYREIQRWGTQRRIEHQSVIEMDKKYGETFNNYDYENRHVCIAPSSPCPVLFGIRAETPERLPAALGAVRCDEKIGRWFIFETNHGTDDHLQMKKIGKIRGYDCVIAEGTVCQPPRNIEGGHTIFKIGDQTGEIDCAVYEPSKQFRQTARKLCLGDMVTAYGGVRDEPRTINIEKLRVKRLADVRIKVANPMCRACGKRMKSAGRNAGYRCAVCGKKAAPETAETKKLKRGIKPGFYEPPPSARRHISKPLRRFVQ